jgi:hypothetical protein
MIELKGGESSMPERLVSMPNMYKDRTEGLTPELRKRLEKSMRRNNKLKKRQSKI